MARARDVQQIAVILGAGIGILNHGAERCTRCGMVEKSAHHFWKVTFLARCGRLVLPRGPAFHLRKDRIKVDRFSGGKAIDYNTDGDAMALAEDGYSNNFTPS